MSPLAPSAASAFLSSTTTLVARTSLESNFDNFKNTFSSWDSCMSKAYCKWPVIAGIILGSLIVLSILTCAARCLCCGLECCFGCFACCNACCPSPRGTNKTTYVQAPQQAWPQQPPAPQPYAWQPNMVYGVPETATFDAPSKNRAAARAAMVGNADALPAMPSWQTAQSRRVEQDDDDVADEETALQETGIAMGAVNKTQRQQVRFTSPEPEGQHVPMLSTPQPRIRRDVSTSSGAGDNLNYDDVDTSYAGALTNTHYSAPQSPPAAPQRSPYDPIPASATVIHPSTSRRAYAPQQAYNDYSNSFGTAATSAPYSPIHDNPPFATSNTAPLRNHYTAHSSPTSYYAPTPLSATSPVAAQGQGFNYNYNHGANAGAGAGVAAAPSVARSPTGSVPPPYMSRAQSVDQEARWHGAPSGVGFSHVPSHQQQQQPQQALEYHPGAYAADERHTRGPNWNRNGSGGGGANGGWVEGRRRSDVARKPVAAVGRGNSNGSGNGGYGGFYGDGGYGNGNGSGSGNGYSGSNWRDV